jgi:transposase
MTSPTPSGAWSCFFRNAADVDVPKLTRLAHAVDRWRAEILAFQTTGVTSNGPTEAVN